MFTGIEAWAEQNYRLLQGEYKGSTIELDRSPWLREPLRAMADPRVHEVTCYAGTQSAKTTGAEIYLGWRLDQDPGNVIYNVENENKAREFGERALPAIEAVDHLSCRVRQRLLSNKMIRLTLSLPNGVWLKVQQANIANAQSDTAPVVINDEAWRFADGLVTEFRNRMGSFRNWKEINVSSGGDEASEVDDRFEAGDQSEFAFKCQNPECGKHFKPLFGRRAKEEYGTFVFRFEVPDEFWSGGKGAPTKERIAKDVQCFCPHCDFEHKDEPAIRMAMVRDGVYIVGNEDAAESKRSFRWNRFVPPWNPWRELVELWLESMRKARNGFTKQLEDFVRKVLAESWRDHLSRSDSPIVGLGEFSQADRRWVIENEEGEEEEIDYVLCASIDTQKDHLWCMITAWAPGFRCRIYDYRKCSDFEDAEYMVRDEWGIENGSFVAVDRSYDPDRVSRECMRRGWVTYMGEDRKEGYPWKVGKETIFKPFAKVKQILIGEGTARAREGIRAKRCDWSNNQIKDALNKLVRGDVGTFEIAAEYDSWGTGSGDFLEQIDSEHKVIITDEKTGRARKVHWVPKRPHRPNNHAWDCLCQATVIGYKTGAA